MKIERDGQLLDIYFNGNGAEVDNSLGLTLQLCFLPLLHFLVPRVGMKFDFPKLRLVTSLRWAYKLRYWCNNHCYTAPFLTAGPAEAIKPPISPSSKMPPVRTAASRSVIPCTAYRSVTDARARRSLIRRGSGSKPPRNKPLIYRRAASRYSILDKKGCGGAIWTNLDVTSVIKRNDHIESCPVDEHLAYKMEKRAVLTKRSAEETTHPGHL
ncbi:hypothetical protein T12_6805 [Trichinella patagoniensis]|uniref:Uncharacterized protein n=1 Tax=Trichinella patagoniensis TaxID=990121 RepID=A0A0V0Z2J7_9BILA|nr:hypothetical protein T12_10151 [Trichinella patagoniensis]KRY06886.1 hypothetical protein T12_6805 [Trichinella patagoniensis]